MPRKKAMPADVKTIASADDLTLDPRNANLGTERGAALLRESLEACGLGRSIVVDKHGVVIAGNKTLTAAREAGIELDVVQTDGQQLVVVQRTDLNLVDQPRARQLAYYENRVQELDLRWSKPQLEQDLLAGVDVGCAFFPEEIDALRDAKIADVAEVADEPAEVAAQATTEPGPVSEPSARAVSSRANYVLEFDSLEQQLRWGAFARLLRKRYPTEKSPGRRLASYVQEVQLG